MKKISLSLMLMILLTGCNLPSLDPVEICLETVVNANQPRTCTCFLYEANIDNVGSVGSSYEIDIDQCPSSVRMNAEALIEINTFHERVRNRYQDELRNN